MATTQKEFDVIVYGATGFTGTLVARYMLEAQESAIGGAQALKWAIAGRSAAKLDKVKEELKTKVPTVAAATIDAVPTVVADSSNEAQLVEMVKKTKVVLTVVGPYKLYGEPVVKACAENGVHYCDLTGETIWISKMVAKYDAEAKKTGAVLVNCCGFESVPSDLTTFQAVDAVKKSKGSTTSKVSLFFTSLKGEASGGTLETVFSLMETATRDEMKQMRNPFFLTNEETRQQKNEAGLVLPNRAALGIKYESDLGKYSAMFFGGSVNMAVVHRSNFLQHGAYGDNFVYRERSAMGGWFVQFATTMALAVVGVMLYFAPTRALLKRIAPKPGQGPSEETQKNGKFVAKAYAYDEAGALAIKATTIGVGDPGYAMTSRVISECAFCLAKGEFGRSEVRKGGFFTSASAFGHELVQRLSKNNIMSTTIEEL